MARLVTTVVLSLVALALASCGSGSKIVHDANDRPVPIAKGRLDDLQKQIDVSFKGAIKSLDKLQGASVEAGVKSQAAEYRETVNNSHNDLRTLAQLSSQNYETARLATDDPDQIKTLNAQFNERYNKLVEFADSINKAAAEVARTRNFDPLERVLGGTDRLMNELRGEVDPGTALWKQHEDGRWTTRIATKGKETTKVSGPIDRTPFLHSNRRMRVDIEGASSEASMQQFAGFLKSEQGPSEINWMGEDGNVQLSPPVARAGDIVEVAKVPPESRYYYWAWREAGGVTRDHWLNENPNAVIVMTVLP